MAAKAPTVQYIRHPDQLSEIVFTDGLAAVEVEAGLLDALPLANDERSDGPRLRRLMRAIRREGFRPIEPIICRIGMKGRWVVVDGGHRLTAVRRLLASPFAWLFPPRIGTLYFLLFTTEGSWKKVRDVAGAGSLPETPPETPPDASAAAQAKKG